MFVLLLVLLFFLLGPNSVWRRSYLDQGVVKAASGVVLGVACVVFQLLCLGVDVLFVEKYDVDEIVVTQSVKNSLN